MTVKNVDAEDVKWDREMQHDVEQGWAGAEPPRTRSSPKATALPQLFSPAPHHDIAEALSVSSVDTGKATYKVPVLLLHRVITAASDYIGDCSLPHPLRASPRHREATHRTHTPCRTMRLVTSTSASPRPSYPPTSAKPHRSRRPPRSANMSAPALSTPGTTSPASLSGVV